jgi:hypothetical protein
VCMRARDQGERRKPTRLLCLTHNCQWMAWEAKTGSGGSTSDNFAEGKRSNTTQDRRKLLSFENSGLGDPVSTFCRSNLRLTSPT